MKQLFVLVGLSLTTSLSAQLFSNMPFTTPQVSNPAFIALNELPQLNVFGKFGPKFNSGYIGYNQYSEKLKGSFGLYYNIFNSQAPDLIQLNKSNMGMTYARLFNINDTWKYSLGVGLELSGGGSHFNGETTLSIDIGGNLGGILYADKFFTAINYSPNLQRPAQLTWRTGYKWQPLSDKNFSLTPMLSVNRFGSRTYLEGNLNIAYKRLSFNLGYNYNGYNAGISYEFKRFRLNYSVGNMFFTGSKQIYHEGGIQFKLSKKHQPRKTNFNHRLF